MNIVNKFGFQLYNINSKLYEIIDNYDGEANEELLNRVDSLLKTKEAVIYNLGLYFFDIKSKIDSLTLEIERLNNLKNKFKKTIELIEKLFEKYVKEGEEYNFDLFSVKWRVNPPKIEEDLFLNLQDLKQKYPELVKIRYELDKTKVKEFYKKNNFLPEGISIKQNKSIIIK